MATPPSSLELNSLAQLTDSQVLPMIATPPDSSDPNPPITSTSTIEGLPQITIDPAGDLVLRFYINSASKVFTAANGKEMRGEIVATMKVSKKVMIENSAPSMAMLNPSGTWAESGATTLDLCHENVAAVELWMKVLHDSVVEDSFKTTSIETIWIAIEAMNGGNRLYKFSVDDLRQLMYLCHEFDDARGFADVTRRLAYENEGHIAEKNPTRFRHLHLQQRIIGGLNAARGNLKSKIHQGIYINRRFLASGCSCKKDGFVAYELALDKTGVWPLEEVLTGKYQLSIQKVLDDLRNFEYDSPNQTCGLCKEDFGKAVVRPTVNSTQHSFDGLCLDCMDLAGRRDWDRDYDNHRYIGSENCRIYHGQPSFYFSWIARKQQPDYYERERDTRKRKMGDEEETFGLTDLNSRERKILKTRSGRG
ncbi:hypothetical protein DL95DRAFT_460295 [Leptodontidium sp. 2 PMI_412]|nr:hypothetical protein DL95DRAFT_460295 [Leptodontidium sp. 2 PMI_412]